MLYSSCADVTCEGKPSENYKLTANYQTEINIVDNAYYYCSGGRKGMLCIYGCFFIFGGYLFHNYREPFVTSFGTFGHNFSALSLSRS